MRRSKRHGRSLTKTGYECKCAMPSCERMVSKKGKVCAACGSWWYYHQAQSAEQYAAYLGRHELAHNRIRNRGRMSRGKA